MRPEPRPEMRPEPRTEVRAEARPEPRAIDPLAGLAAELSRVQPEAPAQKMRPPREREIPRARARSPIARRPPAPAAETRRRPTPTRTSPRWRNAWKRPCAGRSRPSRAAPSAPSRQPMMPAAAPEPMMPEPVAETHAARRCAAHSGAAAARRRGGASHRNPFTTASNRRWRACSAAQTAKLENSKDRPLRPSSDGGGRYRDDPCGGCVSGRCARHQHQSRSGRRAHGTRDPAHRLHHGALAGAVDPDHDDLVHAHRRGAVAAAHRARHRDRAAQCGDRRARALPHRLRDGAGAADRLRQRHPPAGQQRDQRRAGLRARLRSR